MAQRRHHYDRAFEAYLRAKRIPYIAVDEAKKALLPPDAPLRDPAAGGAIKSFDFVVYAQGVGLLVDVKGRRIGASTRLESWATQEDVSSLRRWAELFGAGFEAALVFVYWCDQMPRSALFEEVFEHESRWYALRTAPLDAYERVMRPRSARWGTVHVRREAFERISSPWLCPPRPVREVWGPAPPATRNRAPAAGEHVFATPPGRAYRPPL